MAIARPRIDPKKLQTTPNTRYENVYYRGVKVRTDVIYTDPTTKTNYRIRSVYGVAPSDEKIREQIRTGQLKPDTGIDYSKFAPLNQQIAASRLRERQEAQKIAGIKTEVKKIEPPKPSPTQGGRVVTRRDRYGNIMIVKGSVGSIGSTYAARAAARGQTTTRAVKTQEAIKEKAFVRKVQAATQGFNLRDRTIYAVLLKQGKTPKATSRGVEWTSNGLNYISSGGRILGVKGTTERITFDPVRAIQLEQQRINAEIRAEETARIKAKQKLKYLTDMPLSGYKFDLIPKRMSRKEREALKALYAKEEFKPPKPITKVILNYLGELVQDIKNIAKEFPGVAKKLLIGTKDVIQSTGTRSAQRKQLKDIKTTAELFNNLSELNKAFKQRTKKNITTKDIIELNKKIDLYSKKTKINLKDLNKANKEIFKTAQSKYLYNTVYRYTKGILDFPASILKGSANLLLISIEETPKFPKSFNRIIEHFKILRNLNQSSDIIKLKKFAKRKVTDKDRQRLRKDLQKAIDNLKELRKSPLASKKSKELFLKQETQLALFVGGLIGLGAGAAAIGGTTAAISGVTLKTVGVVATTQTALQTLKEPTPENFGRLTFYALPTAIAILKGFRKLAINFRPSVKNATIYKNYFQVKLKEAREARAFYKKLGQNQQVKFLDKMMALYRQSIKEMNYVIKNPQILKTRDYNPLIHTKEFKKLQGSYKTGIHVSSEAKINNLFGQKVDKVIITLNKLIKEAGKPKIKGKVKVIGLPFTKQRKLSLSFLKYAKDKGLPITGSVAQNIYVGKKFRRVPGDYDIKAKNPLKTAKEISNYLKKEFPNYTIKIQKLRKAIRINVNGKTLVDVAKLKPGVTTIKVKGYTIVSKRELLRGKLEGVVTRRQRVGTKDIEDLVRLTEGKVTVKDILAVRKNPSDVFQVVAVKGGLGKSRLKFDETHMYFDFEGAVAYSKGKPYSVIKFPVVKIKKFPPVLRAKIAKAAAGQLTAKQGAALRVQLNNYIKANPNKFFLGPRTASLPIGEREIVLAEASKFIKGNLYKTFSNDLQRFISIVEVGFKKPAKISIFKKFIDGWKRNPFKTLKYRLTNPDIAKIRSYTKLLEKGYDLNKAQKLNIIELTKKMFKSKKGKVSLLKKEIKKTTRRAKAAPKRKKRIPLVPKRRKVTVKKRKVTITRARKEVRKPTRKPTARKIVRTTKRKIVRKPVRAKPRTPTRKEVRKPTRQPTRITTRAPVRKPTRKTVRKPVRVKPRARTRTPTRIPVRTPPPKQPPKKPPKILPPTWGSKLKRGTTLIVNVIVRIKGKNVEIKTKTTPNRALRKILPLIDKTTSRSFQLKIVGVTKGKDIKKVSLSKFRIRKGKDKRVLKFVEKSKYAIDTKGEKTQLRIARVIKAVKPKKRTVKKKKSKKKGVKRSKKKKR